MAWTHRPSTRPVQNAAIAELIATSVGASSLAWDRLTEIAEERKAGE